MSRFHPSLGGGAAFNHLIEIAKERRRPAQVVVAVEISYGRDADLACVGKVSRCDGLTCIREENPPKPALKRHLSVTKGGSRTLTVCDRIFDRIGKQVKPPQLGFNGVQYLVEFRVSHTSSPQAGRRVAAFGAAGRWLTPGYGALGGRKLKSARKRAATGFPLLVAGLKRVARSAASTAASSP